MSHEIPYPTMQCSWLDLSLVCVVYETEVIGAGIISLFDFSFDQAPNVKTFLHKIVIKMQSNFISKVQSNIRLFEMFEKSLPISKWYQVTLYNKVLLTFDKYVAHC